MNSQTLWIIALSIATPVAGVVGFAIKVREIRKVRLENEKLQLEIDALRSAAEKSNRRIVQATDKERERIFKNILYSRDLLREEGHEEVVPLPEPKESFKAIAIKTVFTFVTLLLLVLFVAYLFFDIYRAIIWIGTKL